MKISRTVKVLNSAMGASVRAGFLQDASAEALLIAAKKKTGFDDFGDPHFRKGLDVLIQSANADAKLTPLGQFIFQKAIIRQLSNRLIWQNARTEHAAFFRSELIPPIIILGAPRTGTTLLHRLLSLDPRHRGVKAFEVFFPFPWISQRKRILRTKANLGVLSVVAPELAKKHPMSALAPEECTAVTAPSFRSYAFWGFGPVYSYMEWLKHADMTAAYKEYETYIRLFQSTDLNRRLILKSPAHTPNLDALISAVPNAKVIQTHRHPRLFLGSLNSLTQSFHEAVSTADVKNTAKMNLSLQSHFIESALAQREKLGLGLVDVFYNELVENPLHSLKTIYKQFNIDFPDELNSLVKEWLINNPQHQRGVHRYSLDHFGISDANVESAFKNYLKRFGKRL